MEKEIDDPIITPEQDDTELIIVCPECEGEELWFDCLELYNLNYIITFICNDCRKRFSTKLSCGFIKYNIQ